jgi:uncharacterized protein YecE (DUF72 family)
LASKPQDSARRGGSCPDPGAGEPGGWRGFIYIRLRGSPRIYYSRYEITALGRIAETMAEARQDVWCIFDNTALGQAPLRTRWKCCWPNSERTG